MNNILYFPYIEIPQNNWLITSLLYWDEIGSIVPYDYVSNPNLYDNKFYKLLVKEQLIKQIIPGEYIWNIPNFSRAFIDYLEKNESKYRLRWPIPYKSVRGRRLNIEKLGTLVHIEKMGDIESYLTKNGYATFAEYPWYKVHPLVAADLMVYLATVIGNHIGFQPATDSFNHIRQLTSTRIYTDTKIYDNNLRSYTLGIRDKVRMEILSNALPIPSDIDIDTLINFKSKYKSQLMRFRLNIEKFLATIYDIPEDEILYRTSLFLEDFGQQKIELENNMRNSKWKMINAGTLCCLGGGFLQNITPYNLNDFSTLAGNGLMLLGAIYSAGQGYRNHVNAIQTNPVFYAILTERRLHGKLMPISFINKTGNYNVPLATNEISSKFNGSIMSNKYHLTNCRYSQHIAPENKVYFETKEQAEALGYVPCGVCKP